MKVDEWFSFGLPGLVRFAGALVGDRGVAEDVVQDVLVRLCADPERFEVVDDLDAYVRRMVVNEFLSWGRKWFRIRPTAQLPEERGARSDPFGLLLDRDQLRYEMARLSRRQRAVLVLRYYEDLDDTEIANVLGCSPSTVRSHASRALRVLRIGIAASEGERKRSS